MFRKLQINLIKKGRMHNQGFITIEKEENAEKTLSGLNGYYFHEKPLIIVNFSKNFVYY